MSLIQLPFKTASLTVLFFRLLCWYNMGHRLAGGLPSIQLECQKKALSPFLTVTTVAALKRAKSVASIGSSMPFHGRSGLDHWSQSHLTRNARLKACSSMISKPPYSIGLATVLHATLHFPPVNSLVPAHRKRLLILSRSAVSCFGCVATLNDCTGRYSINHIVAP
jgi:hypothetical protein